MAKLLLRLNDRRKMEEREGGDKSFNFATFHEYSSLLILVQYTNLGTVS